MAIHKTPGGRAITAAARHRFKPQGTACSIDEEIGYRRGFDQGAAALAYALGISSNDLQRLAWKQRVADFRQGRANDAPSFPTTEERAEFLLLRRRIAADAPMESL